jgi:nucleotide-binding universal stress UspA family protein
MREIETILVTTDFSEHAARVVEPTLVLARAFDARLIVCNVGDLFIGLQPEIVASTAMEQVRQAAAQDQRRQLAAFAARFGSDRPVDQVTLSGTPHVEIVELARERAADLIVIASHGRGFASRVLLGSTTDRVVRHAPCPVLVVPAAG